MPVSAVRSNRPPHQELVYVHCHLQLHPSLPRTSLKTRPRTVPGESAAPVQEIDGFALVIEALKLNGIDTIFGLPGIPITDLTRKLQAAGMRVVSFRHEQNAGYAASIAGFLTQKPGICLTVSAPGSSMA